MRVKVVQQPKPGDTIFFMHDGTKISDIVKNTLWQDAPKGGKVWTYETEQNHMVAFNGVIDFHPAVRLPDEVEIPSDMFDVAPKTTPTSFLTTTTNPTLIAATECVRMGDIGNLYVAINLIGRRIQELIELQSKNSLEKVQGVTSTSPNGL